MTASDAPLTRILVKEHEGFERLYQLILEYVHHPERAASVKEFVFRTHVPDRFYLSRKPHEWEARESNRDSSNETEMGEIVDALGLDGDRKQQWVKALTWMKPEYLDERRPIIHDRSARDIHSFFRCQDTIFATHAAAMLVMLCPNIEKLVYEDDHRSQNAVWDILRLNNYGLVAGSRLQNLRQVRLLPTTRLMMGDERFYVASDLLGLLRMFHRLLAIENVSMDAVCQDGRGDYCPNFPPATANFTKVHIGHSQLSSEEIAALIRAPKRLEEFTFSTGGKAALDGGFALVFRKTIGKALLCHASSLKKLDLDLDDHFFFGKDQAEDQIEQADEEEEEESGLIYGFWNQDKQEMTEPLHPSALIDTRDYGATMGSLHDFSSLTHLCIGIELLLGPRRHKWMAENEMFHAPFRLVDALPQSLEYLLVRGYVKGEDKHFDDHIDELIRFKADRLPRLGTIKGLEQCVPSGKTVNRPDEDDHLLWHVPEFDGEIVG